MGTVKSKLLTVEHCFKVLSKAVKADASYAWSWHCNIAMASVDEGLDHAAANRAAARFMYMCFGVDTSKSKYFHDLFWKEQK